VVVRFGTHYFAYAAEREEQDVDHEVSRAHLIIELATLLPIALLRDSLLSFFSFAGAALELCGHRCCSKLSPADRDRGPPWLAVEGHLLVECAPETERQANEERNVLVHRRCLLSER